MRKDGLICYSMGMTKDEEIEQLRADTRVLYEALLRRDEELELAQQTNQVLRDGLKEAIVGIGSRAASRSTPCKDSSTREPRANQNLGKATSQR